MCQKSLEKKYENSLAQMFSVELSFKKTILSSILSTILSQNLKIDLSTKNIYEKNNPINWDTDKCSICNEYVFFKKYINK